jgi:hypothetical protein
LIADPALSHERSHEYASYIMESIVTNTLKKRRQCPESRWLIENSRLKPALRFPVWLTAWEFILLCRSAAASAGGYENDQHQCPSVDDRGGRDP